MTELASSPVAHTKNGDITLDELAEIQPGMARLMVEVSDRWWIVYYAARGGNWKLAHHEFRETRKLCQIATLVRPKYKESMAKYDEDYFKPVDQALRAQDWNAFAAAYQRSVDGANDAHREFGYEYIEWQLPDSPPLHLKLTPVDGAK